MKLYISAATLQTIKKFGNASLTHIASSRTDHMSVELEVTHPGAAIAAGGAQEAVTNSPFSNCKFRECDLPGQCRGEGACHHPRDAAPLPREAATVLTDGWISVDERLPENDQVVAFVVMTDQQSPNWHLNGRVLGGTYHENWGFSTPGVGHRASHWMPLPAAPAASNGEQA